MPLIKRTEGQYCETEIDDEVVLMNIDNGRFNTLKGTGLAIWKLIDGTRDRDAIVNALTDAYSVSPETCAADVDGFLGTLDKAGLVTLG